MDRYAINTIQCIACKKTQDAGQVCTGCGITLGTYWCSICVLLDDEDKGQFHCADCGICRVGGAAEHTHCHRCGICVKTSALETHTCMSNAARLDCAICLESLHTSRDPIQFLPCGHGLHGSCLRSFFESGQSTCPLCKRSALSEEYQERMIEHMDMELALMPMPEEYRRKQVRIQCNDCQKESDAPFHIMGYKCRAVDQTCGGSYNTVKIGEAPDISDDSESTNLDDHLFGTASGPTNAVDNANILRLLGRLRRLQRPEEVADEEEAVEDADADNTRTP
jgi:RING finger/CHY zinc finger protein 1